MSIEAMKQAFEAWQTSVYGSVSHHKAMLAAMTNMGQAIAEAEKQERRKLLPRCFADYQPNHEEDRECQWCAVKTACQAGETEKEKPVAVNMGLPVEQLYIPQPNRECTRVECMGSKGCIDLCWKQKPVGKLKVTLEDRPIDIELAQYKRMFEAACSALGAVGHALGCNPDEGGAEPLLAAIEELKANSKREPLTFEQIRDLWIENHNKGGATDAFARAIEAAHGIKGNT